MRQLRQLAVEFDLDAHSIGLQNSALKKEAVVTMVALIHAMQRLDELIVACTRLDDSFAARLFEFPQIDWAPRPLPDTVVELVNRTLGWAGRPYFTPEPPTLENHGLPGPAETGCYDWPIDHKPFTYQLSFEPGSYDLLMKVRHAISDEKAFAYLGIEHSWGALGRVSIQPCIVVAPTVDQFDSIRIEQTEDSNADLDSGDIIGALRSVDAKYGVDILSAQMGTVEFRLTNLAPSQRASFSRWYKEFAPDAYHQYKWETNRLPDGQRLVRLWWD